MTGAAPFAIIFGVAGTVAVVFYLAWERFSKNILPLAERYKKDLENAQLKISAEELMLSILALSAILWAAYIVFFRPNIWLTIVMFPTAFGLVFYGAGYWIQGRIKKRLKVFGEQLELILRLLSGGLRAGLSLRQAFVLVIDELPDPAKGEFRRVVSQTNIGVSTNDALSMLAQRMPSDELNMMVRAIRVQSQTGGNLGKILDSLATTIKERRRIMRKVKALTSEGMASGFVVGALPIGVGAFIYLTQPHMRDSTLGTNVGHVGLIIFLVLEAIGIFSVMQIVKIRV